MRGTGSLFLSGGRTPRLPCLRRIALSRSHAKGGNKVHFIHPKTRAVLLDIRGDDEQSRDTDRREHLDLPYPFDPTHQVRLLVASFKHSLEDRRNVVIKITSFRNLLAIVAFLYLTIAFAGFQGTVNLPFVSLTIDKTGINQLSAVTSIGMLLLLLYHLSLRARKNQIVSSCRLLESDLRRFTGYVPEDVFDEWRHYGVDDNPETKQICHHIRRGETNAQHTWKWVVTGLVIFCIIVSTWKGYRYLLESTLAGDKHPLLLVVYSFVLAGLCVLVGWLTKDVLKRYPKLAKTYLGKYMNDFFLGIRSQNALGSDQDNVRQQVEKPCAVDKESR